MRMLIPIPRGGFPTISYVLLDEKTVLFDTVDRASTEQFFENHGACARTGAALDYVVVNHMEPDHCSTLGEIVRRYPGGEGGAATPRRFPLSSSFYNFDIDSRAVIVKEKDTFSTAESIPLHFCDGSDGTLAGGDGDLRYDGQDSLFRRRLRHLWSHERKSLSPMR